LTGAAEPENPWIAETTPNFFEVLKVSAAWGRTDTAADPDGSIVISHALWMRQFAADLGAVGRGVRLGGRLVTIAGMMPPGFSYPRPAFNVWMKGDPTVRAAGKGERGFRILARLDDGYTFERAQAEVRAAATVKEKTGGIYG
jgi:putative ABC transport system permease protein